MTSRPWLSIILAAGLGTRMKSAMPKVMHPVAGRPMAAHAAAGAVAAGASRLAVVIGPEMEPARGALAELRARCPVLHADRQAGHRPCGARRRAGDRGFRRRYHRPLWRHAAAAAGHAVAPARGAGRRGGGRRARLARPPIPPAMGVCCGTRPARCAAIREEREASEAEKRAHLVQFRRDGLPLRACCFRCCAGSAMTTPRANIT